MTSTTVHPFSTYQKQVLFGLGGLLFTVVLDFMLFPALSSVLLERMGLTTGQFGLIASAYPFAAGLSALVTSGLADRFDRKKYLIVFYAGFLLGILICGLAGSYEMLFAARIVAGVFGGVVASISYSIITDIFHEDQRGRAMGALQIAFALSLVAGLPLALLLSSQFDWTMAYFCILGVGLVFLSGICLRMQPVAEHLDRSWRQGCTRHLRQTVSNRRHWLAYSNNTTIVFGDVLFMTFFSAYCTHNLGFSEEVLPLLYGVGGLMALIAGPLTGALADRVGQVPVFWLGSLLVVVNVSAYIVLNTKALWLLLTVHALLMIGITTRMVSSTALATMVPAVETRGAFMSVDASIQQLAAGLAAVLAGTVVVQAVDGRLEHFDVLCFLVMGFVLVSCRLMHLIQQALGRQSA